MRTCLHILVAILIVSCGKNEPVVSPAPFVPAPTQAPPPSTVPNNQNGPFPNGTYPNGTYPNGQSGTGYFPGNGGAGFNPNLPSGYPNQYYPFLPVDNYFRNQPGMSGYWNQFWSGWVNHCQRNQIPVYDFQQFWFQYCPQQWAGTQYSQVYQYFSSNVYQWVQPGMQFQPNIPPQQFWNQWQGYQFPAVHVCVNGYCYQ